MWLIAISQFFAKVNKNILLGDCKRHTAHGPRQIMNFVQHFVQIFFFGGGGVYPLSGAISTGGYTPLSSAMSSGRYTPILVPSLVGVIPLGQCHVQWGVGVYPLPCAMSGGGRYTPCLVPCLGGKPTVQCHVQWGVGVYPLPSAMSGRGPGPC